MVRTGYLLLLRERSASFFLCMQGTILWMEMVLSGLVAASLLSTCDAIFISSMEEHSTCMSCRSTMMIGGAGFSTDGNKGTSMKQQGHFTLIQLLKASNHLTIHVVHTSALRGSFNGWHRSSRQIGHCS